MEDDVEEEWPRIPEGIVILTREQREAKLAEKRRQAEEAQKQLLEEVVENPLILEDVVVQDQDPIFSDFQTSATEDQAQNQEIQEISFDDVAEPKEPEICQILVDTVIEDEDVDLSTVVGNTVIPGIQEELEVQNEEKPIQEQPTVTQETTVIPKIEEEPSTVPQEPTVLHQIKNEPQPAEEEEEGEDEYDD
ncbi:unnamed protein product [Caenorhabditis angaria]|uniref:Uncharacterized protein n=1 Tax=Caenorhabditis angaria TaxID=860376 RepID=A0A9P1IF47_9PELO|nr:unnamed protein product [Caenorhabditis angaria]